MASIFCVCIAILLIFVSCNANEDVNKKQKLYTVDVKNEKPVLFPDTIRIGAMASMDLGDKYLALGTSIQQSWDLFAK
jgi:hypothetical protein